MHLNTLLYKGIILLLLSALPSILCKPTYDQLYDEASLSCDHIIAAREFLHRFPEPSFREYRTAEVIKSSLDAFCISYTSHWCSEPNDPHRNGTGIVAQIGTGEPPCVAIRAVMDSIPVQENTRSSYTSSNEGYMHASGNDFNMAVVLGSAAVLKMYEKELKGTVRFIFQPAEQAGGGALMCEEGVLSKHPPVDNIFGTEITPNLPTGAISTKSGLSHATSDDFVITIKGNGGHAAIHHVTIDPIPPSLAIMKALSDVVSRELYFQQEMAGIISITSFKTPSKATNVIPDQVVMSGTMRALTSKTLDNIKQRLHTIVEKISTSYRCTYAIEHKLTSPPLYNDYTLYKLFEESLKRAGLTLTNNYEIKMESTDLASYANYVPSLLISLGSGSGSQLPGHPNTNVEQYNPNYAADERALPMGIAVNAHFAFSILDYLYNKMDENRDEL